MKGFSIAQKLDKLGMPQPTTGELVIPEREVGACRKVLGQLSTGGARCDERAGLRARRAHWRAAGHHAKRDGQRGALHPRPQAVWSRALASFSSSRARHGTTDNWAAPATNLVAGSRGRRGGAPAWSRACQRAYLLKKAAPATAMGHDKCLTTMMLGRPGRRLQSRPARWHFERRLRITYQVHTRGAGRICHRQRAARTGRSPKRRFRCRDRAGHRQNPQRRCDGERGRRPGQGQARQDHQLEARVQERRHHHGRIQLQHQRRRSRPGADARIHRQGAGLQARILARSRSHATFAQEPELFTTAPVGATQKALKKAGWKVEDVDLWEINEAFAVVPMALMADLKVPHDKVNVNGGACALGHPIGAQRARTWLTLLHALAARGKSAAWPPCALAAARQRPWLSSCLVCGAEPLSVFPAIFDDYLREGLGRSYRFPKDDDDRWSAFEVRQRDAAPGTPADVLSLRLGANAVATRADLPHYVEVRMPVVNALDFDRAKQVQESLQAAWKPLEQGILAFSRVNGAGALVSGFYVENAVAAAAQVHAAAQQHADDLDVDVSTMFDPSWQEFCALYAAAGPGGDDDGEDA
ncbi:hypothetical protein FQA39_LY18561 [Lamprigera yunnana]|nr:hypothetical protein FQA39_LY18561 [Lamprigera yunnana]